MFNSPWRCTSLLEEERVSGRIPGTSQMLTTKSLTLDSRNVASISSSQATNIKCLVSLQLSHANKQIDVLKVESYPILKCCLV